jgi:streptogramin lyase
VQIDPATRAMKVFQPPATVAGNLQPFNDLYTSDDGMWSTQTTGNVLQRFDYATETFETFRVPTPLALPLGLYVASDGVVYVAELLANQILTLDPATGRVEEWPLPEALLYVCRFARGAWGGLMGRVVVC